MLSTKSFPQFGHDHTAYFSPFSEQPLWPSNPLSKKSISVPCLFNISPLVGGCFIYPAWDTCSDSLREWDCTIAAEQRSGGQSLEIQSKKTTGMPGAMHVCDAWVMGESLWLNNSTISSAGKAFTTIWDSRIWTTKLALCVGRCFCHIRYVLALSPQRYRK